MNNTTPWEHENYDPTKGRKGTVTYPKREQQHETNTNSAEQSPSDV